MSCHLTSRNISISQDGMRTALIDSDNLLHPPPLLLPSVLHQCKLSENMTMLFSYLNFLVDTLESSDERSKPKSSMFVSSRSSLICLVNLFPPSFRQVAVVAQVMSDSL